MSTFVFNKTSEPLVVLGWKLKPAQKRIPNIMPDIFISRRHVTDAMWNDLCQVDAVLGPVRVRFEGCEVELDVIARFTGREFRHETSLH